MALGRFVVGEAWVELHLDTDPLQRKLATTLPDQETQRLGSNWGRSAGRAFSEAFTSSGFTTETIARFRRGGENAGDQAGSAAKSALERKLNSLNIRTIDLKVDAQTALREIDRVERELNDLNNNEANVDVRINTQEALAELERFKARVRATLSNAAEMEVKLDYDTVGSRLRNTLKDALVSAFTPSPEIAQGLFEMMAFGTSRALVAMFSSPVGLGIGLALAGALAAGIASAAVFIGAALTGALVGGLNIGLIAAGIALVVDHPRIKKAGDKLTENLMGGLKNAAKPFIQPTVDAIERLNKAVDKVMPHIDRIFRILAPFVSKFADALADSLETIAPALEQLVRASGPVLNAIAQVIRDMGPAIAGFFTALSDPEAMKGAAQAVKDLGMALKFVLPALGDFLKELAISWPAIREPAMAILGILKDMVSQNFDWDRFRQGLRDALILIQFILSALKEIQNLSLFGASDTPLMTLFSPFPVEAYATAIKAAIREIKEAWHDLKEDIRNIIDGIEGFFKRIGDAFDRLKKFFENPLGGGGGGTLGGAGGGGIFDSLAQGAERAKNGVIGAFSAISNVVSSVMGSMANGVTIAWNSIQGIFNTMIGFISGIFSSLWTNLQGHVSGVMNGISNIVSGAWNAIQSGLNAAIGFLAGAFSAVWSNLLGHVSGIMSGLRSTAENAWNAIRGAFESAIGFLAGAFSAVWSNLLGHVSGIMSGLRSTAENAWNAIRSTFESAIGFVAGAFSALWTNLGNHVAGVMDGIRRTIEDAKNAIRGALENVIGFVSREFSALWTNLLNHVAGVMSGIRGRIEDAKNAIRGSLENVIGFVSREFSALWTNIRNHISGIMDAISGKFGDFKNSTVRIFSEIRDTIGRIWNEMIGAAKSAIHTMAGFLNSAIDAVNKIPFMKDKIGRLEGFANGGEIKLAYGGAVFGGPSGTDTVPAWGSNGQRYLLDNGEHILTRRDVNAMGGQEAVYSFRRSLHKTGDYFLNGGPVKMATGGRVDGRNNGLLEQHRDHVHVAMNVPPMGFPLIIARAVASGIPHRVSSTFRPGDMAQSGPSHHSTGRAVDFGGFNQDRFASFWEGVSGVIELIHRTNTRDYAIFGGKASAGGGGIGAISWILSAAGKAVKALFDKAMGGFKGFVGGDLLKGSNMAPTILRNIGSAMMSNITSFFDEQSSFGDGGGGSPAGSAQLKAWIAEAQKYVNIEWIEGLITLIMRESGGNPRAINRTDSNAQRGDPSRGLMQTIGATFSKFRDSRLPNDIYDPVANIVAGMNYIHSRYGSLRNVQTAHANQPPKGYWEGVRSAPKGEALVGEGGAELMNFSGGESVTPIEGGVWRINNMTVNIDAKDLEEVKNVTEWFDKLQEQARKGARVG